MKSSFSIEVAPLILQKKSATNLEYVKEIMRVGSPTMVYLFTEYFGMILTMMFVGMLNDPVKLAAVGIGNMCNTMACLSFCYGLNTALPTFIS